MDQLQIQINNLDNIKPDLDNYNNILEKCAKFHEMTALVYVYDHMKNHDVKPNNLSYKYINRLHSKTISESNKIIVKSSIGRKLEPRRRIHKIMKGYNYTDNYQNALQHKEKVLAFLSNHKELLEGNRIVLAKKISKECQISFNDARYIITNLKRAKYFSDKSDNRQNKIESYFRVNNE